MIEFIRPETADRIPERVKEEARIPGKAPESGPYDPVSGYVRCRNCVWFAPYNEKEGDPTGLCICTRSPCWNQTVGTTFFCADWGRK